MNQAATISRRAALLWGNAGLISALAVLLAAIVFVSFQAPELVIYVPGVIAVACLAVFLFSNPRLNFVVWLCGFSLLLSSEAGIQPHEVAYGIYFYIYLIHWYGRRVFLYNRTFINSSLDLAVGLWLGLALTVGTALGFLFGANPTNIRGEWLALTVIAIYFPIKEFVTREKQGTAILLAILAFMGLWVTFDNALEARRTLVSATALWEIETVRKAGRELLLTFSGIMLLAILPVIRRRVWQVGLAVILAILLGGLILTKSRAFWVEYLVAVIVLIAITPGVERRRLLMWCCAGIGVVSLVSILFLSSYFNLLIAGTSSRFATLGAASDDLSLLNRFVEAHAVLEKVKWNPILGFGLATDYSFFDIIAYKTRTRGYVHIGYVAVLYKFGLWGVLLIAYVWLSSLVTVYRTAKSKIINRLDHAVLRGVFACLASTVIAAITSSVFFEPDKLSAFILLVALGTGIHLKQQRRQAQAMRGNMADAT